MTTEQALQALVEAARPFARLGSLVERYDDFRAHVSKGHWPESFRAIAAAIQAAEQALGSQKGMGSE